MPLVPQQWAFLCDFAKLILWAESQGFVLTGGELWRTLEQQAIYVKKGLSDTMNSQHGKRLAIDLNLFIGGVLQGAKKYEPLGVYWESLSPQNRWGGRFKRNDANHFERLEL